MHATRFVLAISFLLACGSATLAAEPSAHVFQEKDARVVMSVSGTKFKVGQPIPYEIKVTNLWNTTLPYTYCWSWRVSPGYLIEVLDKSGKALPQPQAIAAMSFLGIGAKLEAGDTVTFKGYLNQFAALGTPGTYTAKASWSPYDHNVAGSGRAMSAPVKIEIEKPTDVERDKILADARKQLQNASTLDEMQDAIWAMAYTLDVRAIPDLVQASQRHERLPRRRGRACPILQ